MERVDKLMEKLGFNPESTDGAKAAFIKNLIKQAYGVDVEIPAKYQEPEAETFEQFTMAKLDRHSLDPQLSFNIEAAFETKPKAG